MKTGKRIALSLLGILSTFCIAGGVSACKSKSNPMMAPENATTVRKVTPNDGSLPTAHEPLDNIGHMAYVLDNQPFYHAYARNSSKAMGYEQITQTWKDYKSAAESGIGESVLVTSDISYSSLVKSAVQLCTVGSRDSYGRGGSKPGKSTTSTTEEWSQDPPAYYDKDAYFHKYGEFSTELCVYVINEYTLASASEVTVKEDGTFEQTYYLNEQAGCWYQYKMKTNGNLKKYPKFEHVQITFNFDSSWRVLSSYCEEKIEIAPSALGGISTTSNSKTTTTFYYGAEEFDNAHYAYFDSYFRQHLGTRPQPSTPTEDEPDVMTLLGNGFSQVVDPNGNGQQFDLDLTIGDTQYTGKAYAKLSDMNNVLSSLDVRVALERKGSGAQDLYIEFKNGGINVYYSDTFAMTANIDAVSTVVKQFSDWVKKFKAPATVSPAAYSPAEGEESNSPIAALLAQLKLDCTDTSATVSLATDNLMGTGIGVNLTLGFSRTKTESGSVYSFSSADISSITYDNTSIKLTANLLPSAPGSTPVSREESSTPADLANYMTSVYNMLNSNTLKVDIKLDGTKDGVISALEGANVDLTAYLALGNDTALKADLAATYGGVTAKLSAYYGVNLTNGDYGDIYLNLTELNGKAMNGKVRCDINGTVDAVKQLISSINGAQTQAASAVAYSAEDTNGLAQIINKALSLDFGKVFGEIYASNSQIRLAVDVDEIIGAIGLNVNGLKFGTAALALTNGEKASLALGLPALGLTVNVAGSSQAVNQPSADEYFDVIELVDLVKTAAEEAKKIISAKDISFNIDATVIADDIPLSVIGRGEVIWVDGKVKVAVDVTLSVADGTSEAANKNSVALKLVYDPSAAAGEPLAAFTVNSLGMEIYQSDLDGIKADIKKISDAISTLIGGNKTGNATPEQTVALYGATYDTSNGTGTNSGTGSDIVTILTSENVQKILKAVLGFVGNISSVELQYGGVNNETVNGLIIRHAVNGGITLGADNKLSLALEINNNNGTRIVEGSASVAAGNGATLTALRGDFANGGYKFYTTAEAGEKFVKIVYDYLFAVIKDVSIAEVLGGKTYTVTATLDGAKSDIPALQNVSVNASLYYTEGLEGDKIVDGKLAEIDIDLMIGDTPVSLNARYNAGYIFIDLRKIANVTLTDIKVKANANDIYSVAKQVVDLITSSAVLDLVKGNTAGGQTTTEATAAVYSLSRDTQASSSLTNVISKLLSLNFSEAFSYKKVSGVNTATLNIDYILNYLGVSPNFDIGVISVGINPESHKVTADVDLNGNKWAALSAEAAERRAYAEGWQNSYIDISFVSTLLDDITKTAINGDTVNTLYTLTGEIDIGIHAINIINIDFTISNVKLSAGFDENNQFYLTLSGHLPAKSYLMYEVTKDMDISVTYSGGYITLGRQNEAKQNIYRVVTLEYLLDNLMDSTNSPVRWLLGTSPDAWNLVGKAVKLNIDSGLTKPESLYLYNQTQKPKEEKSFALGDILKALSVSVDGKEVSHNGGSAAVSKWGLTDNYYALDINGDKLTGGTVKALYAAILRDGTNGGLTGLKAFASVAGALEANIKLDGLTTDRSVAAPDYLQFVKETYNPNFDYYKGSTENTSTHTTSTFGCYNTEPANEADRYSSSEVLSPVTLTVSGYGNVVESHVVTLRYGSTVHLTNSFAPVWANDEHTLKIIFTDEAGNDLGSQIVLNDDILDANRNFMVKAVTAEVVEVNFNIGLAGIDTVDAALSHGETLTPYDREISGYMFIGWYNDEAKTERVYNVEEITNVVNGVKTVYGKFVESTVTVNGVIYTFTADNSAAGGYYTVTGTDAAAIAPFTAEGSWLILENEINTIPVTSIAAYQDETANSLGKANLKNVVVPENIVTIGSRAFLDNYGIKTVVITADNVYFDGTDKNTVFYGCSTGNGTTDTYLQVYYNNYTAAAGSNWGHFRDGDHYIDRGSNGGAHSGGSWAFVQTVQGGVSMSALECNILGVRTDTLTAEQLAAQAIAEINGNTANSNGYINAYEVEVSGGYYPNGKINTINITVRNAEAFWYPVTVDGTDAYVTGDYVTTFNGVTYAKAGETVTVKTDVDHYISSATSAQVAIDATNFTFTMPDNGNGVTVTVVCEKVGINEVTLKSNIAVDGYEYVAGWYVSSEAVTESDLTLTAPTAQGYIFLGWAYENNGSLSFTGSTFNADTVASSVYYAVWAYNADGKLSAETTALVAGTNPNEDISNVKVDTSKANSLYKWYTDAELSTEANSLTTSTTVLYAKVYYTVKFGLWGNNDIFIYYDTPTDHSHSDANSKTDKKREHYIDIAVLEGDKVQVEIFDSGNQLKLTYGNDSYWIRAKKVSWTGGVGGSYAVKEVKVDGVVLDLSSSKQLTVNGNMSVSGEF